MFKEFSFRGKPFLTSCVEVPDYQHPSWFTFVDEQVVRDAFWDIQPGEKILDVGAAFGSYALSALAVGAAFVWAWSPQAAPDGRPERDFFLESLQANGWADRCKIFDTGVFDRAGYLHTGDQTLTQEPREGWEIIRVETLDAWADRELPPQERVDWLKLDVEGAEAEVLNGGLRLLRSHMPKLLIENHAFKRPSVEHEVREIVLGLGYREVATVPHHGVTHSLYVPA